MSQRSFTPVRTCLGCRSRKPKFDLVRFVLTKDGLQVDAEQKQPSRGAYTCADVGCLKIALNRKAFTRSFRRQVNINEKRLYREFFACLKKR